MKTKIKCCSFQLTLFNEVKEKCFYSFPIPNNNMFTVEFTFTKVSFNFLEENYFPIRKIDKVKLGNQ